MWRISDARRASVARQIDTPSAGSWPHFGSLDAWRGVDVCDGNFNVLDRAVDLAEPVRGARQVHDHAAGPDLAREAARDADGAPDCRIRVGVRVRVGVTVGVRVKVGLAPGVEEVPSGDTVTLGVNSVGVTGLSDGIIGGSVTNTVGVLVG